MYLLGPHDPCHLELAVESVTIRADQQALLQCMLIQIDHCAPVCSVRMSHSRCRCSAFCAGRRMLLLRAFVKYAPDTSATEGSVARKNSSVACCEQGATRRQQCAASLNRHLHHCACFLGKVQTLSARTLMSMPHIPQPASSIFVLTVPVVRKHGEGFSQAPGASCPCTMHDLQVPAGYLGPGSWLSLSSRPSATVHRAPH